MLSDTYLVICSRMIRMICTCSLLSPYLIMNEQSIQIQATMWSSFSAIILAFFVVWNLSISVEVFSVSKPLDQCFPNCLPCGYHSWPYSFPAAYQAGFGTGNTHYYYSSPDIISPINKHRFQHSAFPEITLHTNLHYVDTVAQWDPCKGFPV